ncbi:MAG TPA: phosphatidylserine decarboxylase [Syntrophales bacterium]|nr:phosphatidylserine decarboxylase [Syntrophales bacterium]
MLHQYIERESGRVLTERLYGNGAIKLLYSELREYAPAFFRALTCARASRLIGFLNYEFFIGEKMFRHMDFLQSRGIDLQECVDAPENLDTAKKIFERKIRYWEYRPMPSNTDVILSPADARMLVGSFSESSHLFIKGKFFDYEEMLWTDKKTWLRAFEKGDFAIFRLTPEKYHYNHTPVAGKVIDFYQLQGDYHSCNPNAVLSIATPYSKNRRVVTIIDTDVEGGTGAGLVAMIEVVAMMIGDIVQCYSEEEYADPVPVGTGMCIKKGAPKSRYRPGSSTDVLIFQPGRVKFDYDIILNMFHQDAESLYCKGFGMPLMETEVKVRSAIGRAVR